MEREIRHPFEFPESSYEREVAKLQMEFELENARLNAPKNRWSSKIAEFKLRVELISTRMGELRRAHYLGKQELKILDEIMRLFKWQEQENDAQCYRDRRAEIVNLHDAVLMLREERKDIQAHQEAGTMASLQ